MALDPNDEKFQELSIIVGDHLRSVDKRWWLATVLVLVLSMPAYYTMRATFASIIVSNHKFPAYIYQDEAKVDLEIVDKKIFKLGPDSYSGYVKIRNSANYEWGVAQQQYTAVFSTTGNTEVMRYPGTTYVLPASEKIIVFGRFSGNGQEPTQLNVSLGETRFIRKPNRPPANLTVERTNLIKETQLTVTAAVKNNTPFTIKQVDLPILLYDTNNQVVGVNYTNINDVRYTETRSFQFSWPNLPNAVRAEILPEVNIFDPNIYKLADGTSQFDPPSN